MSRFNNVFFMHHDPRSRFGRGRGRPPSRENRFRRTNFSVPLLETPAVESQSFGSGPSGYEWRYSRDLPQHDARHNQQQQNFNQPQQNWMIGSQLYDTSELQHGTGYVPWNQGSIQAQGNNVEFGKNERFPDWNQWSSDFQEGRDNHQFDNRFRWQRDKNISNMRGFSNQNPSFGSRPNNLQQSCTFGLSNIVVNTSNYQVCHDMSTWNDLTNQRDGSYPGVTVQNIPSLFSRRLGRGGVGKMSKPSATKTVHAGLASSNGVLDSVSVNDLSHINVSSEPASRTNKAYRNETVKSESNCAEMPVCNPVTLKLDEILLGGEDTSRSTTLASFEPDETSKSTSAVIGSFVKDDTAKSIAAVASFEQLETENSIATIVSSFALDEGSKLPTSASKDDSSIDKIENCFSNLQPVSSELSLKMVQKCTSIVSSVKMTDSVDTLSNGESLETLPTEECHSSFENIQNFSSTEVQNAVVSVPMHTSDTVDIGGSSYIDAVLLPSIDISKSLSTSRKKLSNNILEGNAKKLNGAITSSPSLSKLHCNPNNLSETNVLGNSSLRTKQANNTDYIEKGKNDISKPHKPSNFSLIDKSRTIVDKDTVRMNKQAAPAHLHKSDTSKKLCESKAHQKLSSQGKLPDILSNEDKRKEDKTSVAQPSRPKNSSKTQSEEYKRNSSSATKKPTSLSTRQEETAIGDKCKDVKTSASRNTTSKFRGSSFKNVFESNEQSNPPSRSKVLRTSDNSGNNAEKINTSCARPSKSNQASKTLSKTNKQKTSSLRDELVNAVSSGRSCKDGEALAAHTPNSKRTLTCATVDKHSNSSKRIKLTDAMENGSKCAKNACQSVHNSSTTLRVTKSSIDHKDSKTSQSTRRLKTHSQMPVSHEANLLRVASVSVQPAAEAVGTVKDAKSSSSGNKEHKKIRPKKGNESYNKQSSLVTDRSSTTGEDRKQTGFSAPKPNSTHKALKRTKESTKQAVIVKSDLSEHIQKQPLSSGANIAIELCKIPSKLDHGLKNLNILNAGFTQESSQGQEQLCKISKEDGCKERKVSKNSRERKQLDEGRQHGTPKKHLKRKIEDWLFPSDSSVLPTKNREEILCESNKALIPMEENEDQLFAVTDVQESVSKVKRNKRKKHTNDLLPLKADLVKPRQREQSTEKNLQSTELISQETPEEELIEKQNTVTDLKQGNKPQYVKKDTVFITYEEFMQQTREQSKLKSSWHSKLDKEKSHVKTKPKDSKSLQKITLNPYQQGSDFSDNVPVLTDIKTECTQSEKQIALDFVGLTPLIGCETSSESMQKEEWIEDCFVGHKRPRMSQCPKLHQEGSHSSDDTLAFTLSDMKPERILSEEQVAVNFVNVLPCISGETSSELTIKKEASIKDNFVSDHYPRKRECPEIVDLTDGEIIIKSEDQGLVFSEKGSSEADELQRNSFMSLALHLMAAYTDYEKFKYSQHLASVHLKSQVSIQHCIQEAKEALYNRITPVQPQIEQLTFHLENQLKPGEVFFDLLRRAVLSLPDAFQSKVQELSIEVIQEIYQLCFDVKWRKVVKPTTSQYVCRNSAESVPMRAAFQLSEGDYVHDNEWRESPAQEISNPQWLMRERNQYPVQLINQSTPEGEPSHAQHYQNDVAQPIATNKHGYDQFHQQSPEALNVSSSVQPSNRSNLQQKVYPNITAASYHFDHQANVTIPAKCGSSQLANSCQDPAMYQNSNVSNPILMPATNLSECISSPICMPHQSSRSSLPPPVHRLPEEQGSQTSETFNRFRAQATRTLSTDSGYLTSTPGPSPMSVDDYPSNHNIKWEPTEWINTLKNASP